MENLNTVIEEAVNIDAKISSRVAARDIIRKFVNDLYLCTYMNLSFIYLFIRLFILFLDILSLHYYFVFFKLRIKNRRLCGSAPRENALSWYSIELSLFDLATNNAKNSVCCVVTVAS